MSALQDGTNERLTSRRVELLARIAVLLQELPNEDVEKLIEMWISELHTTNLSLTNNQASTD